MWLRGILDGVAQVSLRQVCLKGNKEGQNECGVGVVENIMV